MPSAVSFRYARALVDSVTGPTAAGPTRDPQGVASQLTAFHDLFTANNDLQILFSTPAVTADKKKSILAELAPAIGLESLARNFLNVVIDHDRMQLVGEIVEAFQALLNERLGIAVAEVTTARPLDEAEKRELAGALSARTGKQVRMNFSLDPELLGGIVARIDSTIYDGSVRGNLQRLRADLIGE